MDPLQSGPPVIVSARVSILRRSTVINRNYHCLAMVNKAAAEGVIDGAIGGGMNEATPVEEDNDGDDLGSAEGGFEVDDAGLGGVIW